MNRSEVDRLGTRLREGDTSEADLIALDAYRQSARADYDEVVRRISDESVAATGRPAKSTRSIVDKLRRESSRLTQIQDIAGCRVVVSGIEAQDILAGRLLKVLPGSKLIDRRQSPSFGYRAVHLVYKGTLAPIEVQIRTALQHAWAELSEKLSDRLGAEIKYGKGDEQVRTVLDLVSATIAEFEHVETQYLILLAKRTNLIEAIRGVSTQSRFNELKALLSELDETLAVQQSGAEGQKAKLLILIKDSAASWVQ